MHREPVRACSHSSVYGYIDRVGLVILTKRAFVSIPGVPAYTLTTIYTHVNHCLEYGTRNICSRKPSTKSQ